MATLQPNGHPPKQSIQATLAAAAGAVLAVIFCEGISITQHLQHYFFSNCHA